MSAEPGVSPENTGVAQTKYMRESESKDPYWILLMCTGVSQMIKNKVQSSLSRTLKISKENVKLLLAKSCREFLAVIPTIISYSCKNCHIEFFY